MPYALITGASKGIGRSIAFELAKRNYDLLLTASSLDLLKEAAGEIQKLYAVNVHFIAVDLSENNASQQLFAWCMGKNYAVSILINNAGAETSVLFQGSSIEKNTKLIYLKVV